MDEQKIKKSIEKISNMEIELVDMKLEYEEKKADINLTTDFKALNLTNQSLRDAYISKNLIHLKREIEMQNIEIAKNRKLYDIDFELFKKDLEKI